MTSATAIPAVTTLTQRLIRSRPEDMLPLDIEHQRVYILPTKRGLAYVFSLMIMLIASINYALSLGYALCFLLTGLFSASLLHTYRNVAGITCEKIASEHVFAGQCAHFAVAIRNKTKLERIGVTLKCTDASDTINIAVGGVSHAVLIKPTTTRGILKLGRITISEPGAICTAMNKAWFTHARKNRRRHCHPKTLIHRVKLCKKPITEMSLACANIIPGTPYPPLHGKLQHGDKACS